MSEVDLIKLCKANSTKELAEHITAEVYYFYQYFFYFVY